DVQAAVDAGNAAAGGAETETGQVGGPDSHVPLDTHVEEREAPSAVEDAAALGGSGAEGHEAAVLGLAPRDGQVAEDGGHAREAVEDTVEAVAVDGRQGCAGALDGEGVPGLRQIEVAQGGVVLLAGAVGDGQPVDAGRERDDVVLAVAVGGD